MNCAIYRSLRKWDTYLYVEKPDEFERVPQSLRDALGRLEFVMNLELGPARKLANADPEQVRQQLREQGYYLQLPPKEGHPFDRETWE